MAFRRDAGEREGRIVFDSACDKGDARWFSLRFGDAIVLSGRSRYWFGSLRSAEKVSGPAMNVQVHNESPSMSLVQVM